MKRNEESKQKKEVRVDKEEKKRKKKTGEKKKGETNKREKEKKRFHFSLRFTETGPLVFVGAKSKVGPRIEIYA